MEPCSTTGCLYDAIYTDESGNYLCSYCESNRKLDTLTIENYTSDSYDILSANMILDKKNERVLKLEHVCVPNTDEKGYVESKRALERVIDDNKLLYKIERKSPQKTCYVTLYKRKRLNHMNYNTPTINAQLILDGWGWPSPNANSDFKSFQLDALNYGRGLWKSL